MRYSEFEQIMSQPRMNRYLIAVGNDKKRALTLYRKNLRLSQELFAVVSYFEIALRNRVNDHYTTTLGGNWLRDGSRYGGIFDNPQNAATRKIIYDAFNSLRGNYSHPKLVSELNFGFWRYLFSRYQYRACGQTLINIFPNRPASNSRIQYNARFVFNELKKINLLRNRIAHHDQICFQTGAPIINTAYVQQNYNNILRLFQWMDIESRSLLFGVDRVQQVINEINAY